MRDELLKLLFEEFPEIDFEASEELVDDGILDSLVIVGVISTITVEYGITITYENIIPENFNSLDAMAALVSRLRS